MSRRPNRATVSDVGLGEAFAEGLNEGFRLTGYVLAVCKVGDRETFRGVVKASQVPDVVGDFIAGLRGEHYEVGVSVRIIAEGDVGDEAEAAGAEGNGAAEIADGIEDAEVVEEP